MTEYDWTDLAASGTVDEMATKLQLVIEELTDMHFPLARVRKRSNELPWVTKRIRRLWKRKLQIFKKKGRSVAWWEANRALQTTLEESRNLFVDTLLEDGSNGKSFYSATPPWTVSDLYVGVDPSKMCDDILKFYSNISSAAAEPMPDVPRTDGGLGDFSIERTTDLLWAAKKKSNSRVEGDPLAHLVRLYPTAFAEPVSIIYNEINRGGNWPAKWKTEHLTIIPKVPNPSELAECRNISCTSIFSKILEGVVLKKLRAELEPDPAQYLGIPKCGAEHMLVDIWDRVMAAMER